MTDKKILWLIMGISLMAITLGIGWLRFEHKQEELKRNRKYEISLVKALKNSYEGIEEIEITDPSYTYPPGAWSCDIAITFHDGKNTSYRIGHSLDKTQNYQGSRQSDDDWEYLEKHKGQTTDKVKVRYSDTATGKQ